jgi:hypothetical protein
MIPAAAITQPGARALAVLEGRFGLFDIARNPYVPERAPFRITPESLIGTSPERDRAMAVLRSLAPGVQWFARPLETTGLWLIWYDRVVATPSRDPSQPPLQAVSSPERWLASFRHAGTPRVPTGLHRIELPQRSMLIRQ